MGEAFTLILVPTLCLVAWTLRWGIDRWVDMHCKLSSQRRRERNR